MSTHSPSSLPCKYFHGLTFPPLVIRHPQHVLSKRLTSCPTTTPSPFHSSFLLLLPLPIFSTVTSHLSLVLFPTISSLPSLSPPVVFPSSCISLLQLSPPPTADHLSYSPTLLQPSLPFLLPSSFPRTRSSLPLSSPVARTLPPLTSVSTPPPSYLSPVPRSPSLLPTRAHLCISSPLSLQPAPIPFWPRPNKAPPLRSRGRQTLGGRSGPACHVIT